MNRTVAGLVALAFAVMAGAQAPEGFMPPEDWPEGWYSRIDTSRGPVIVRLLPEQAPDSVAYFAALANGTIEWTDPVTGEPHHERYYDGSEVTRAEGGILFQVGQVSSRGTFAPFLYVPPREGQPIDFSAGWRIGNVRVGTKISAARWFITVGSMPGLNGTVPCFGVVMDGKETAFQITSVKTGGGGRPLDPVTIERVRIFKIGDPPPLPEPIPYFPEIEPLVELDTDEKFKREGR